VSTREADPGVRIATGDDAGELARLFRDFNTEFDEAVPEIPVLTERISEHIAGDDATFLLAGEGPDGFSMVRFRPQLTSPAAGAYLEELYVAPAMRGNGLGRALLEATMEEARRRGADHIDLNTSVDDLAAIGLYESAGFTNHEGRPDGPSMLYYEREL
jgi:ribosomal protein S18 acetylase RimI-like enzyme